MRDSPYIFILLSLHGSVPNLRSCFEPTSYSIFTEIQNEIFAASGSEARMAIGAIGDRAGPRLKCHPAGPESFVYARVNNFLL